MKNTTLISMLTLLSCGVFSSVDAASQTPSEAELTAFPDRLYEERDHPFQSWRDNWFIQLGAGINQPFVERGINGAKAPGKAVRRKNMTTVYNIGVGHWFSPYLAFRINGFGGSLHWNNPAIPDQEGWSKAKHVNLNAELMWDMCNSIAGINPERLFSVIPFVGVGSDYTWGLANDPATNIVVGKDGKRRNVSWTLPVSAGVQLRFRICSKVDFFAEMRASFYGDNWNGCSYGRPIEANVAALGGFDFNITGREWQRYNSDEVTSRLAWLNNEVNSLRMQNEMLTRENNLLKGKTNSAQPSGSVKQPTIEQEVPLLATVRFTIGSDEILPTEEVNIYNMAEWLKDNPKEKVVICGYADKDTGTAEYNLELSKRRADVVYEALTQKYGISPEQLVVEYDGSRVQPYSTNDWNRIVIFSVK